MSAPSTDRSDAPRAVPLAAPPRPARAGQRVPSGPCPAKSHSTLRLSSAESTAHPMPVSEGSGRFFDGGAGLTTSPEQSPPAVESPSSIFSRLPREQGEGDPEEQRAAGGRNGNADPSHPRGASEPYAAPTHGESMSAAHFRSPTSPAPVTSPRARPVALRLNTNLAPPPTSPRKIVSPSLKHWQQIRTHVLATPLEEQQAQAQAQHKGRERAKEKRRSNLVFRTVGRLGLKQAAENVMGLDDRRRSLAVYMGELGDLSAEDKEEIARERRKFSRDIRVCLDACAEEDSRRRLARAAGARRDDRDRDAKSSHGASLTFHPDFSAYAPLLTELHKFLPAARARKIWSRTLPHHGAVLAELATAFLPDGLTTDGERQQALEVFGAVVRNWASEGGGDELDRWTWLAQALSVGDRQLCRRGLPLLSAFLHNDPGLPASPERPAGAKAFVRLAMALVRLLHGLAGAEYDASEHQNSVMAMLSDMVEGGVILVDEESVAALVRADVHGAAGIERELLWTALGTLMVDVDIAEWLLSPENPLLIRSAPHPILHATPPSVLHVRAHASIVIMRSVALSLMRMSAETAVRAWQAVVDLVLPQLDLFPTQHGTAAARTDLLVRMLLRRYRDIGRDDPFDGPTELQVKATQAQEMLSAALASTEREKVLDAWAAAISEADEGIVVRAMEALLRDQSAKMLATGAVEAFIKLRPSPTSHAFLTRLCRLHPALFYKPLFTLSACTSPSDLPARLAVVRALVLAVGVTEFWLEADPQMLGVVLCAGSPTGPTSTDVHTGGAGEVTNVRLGRHAVLLELIAVVRGIGEVLKGSTARTLLDGVESRVGSAVVEQTKRGELPSLYKTLLCVFFRAVRTATRSTRRSAWMGAVLGWLSTSPVVDGSGLLDLLRTLYQPSPPGATPEASKQNGAMDPTLATILQTPLETAVAQLIVLVQSCWMPDDWSTVLPIAWRRFDLHADRSYLFCLAKCAEICPGALRDLISHDFAVPSSRASTVRKLAALYGLRYQVLEPRILSDRRGPALHFPADAFVFAPTEIGSAAWRPPQEMQDAALDQFGRTLPLDVRQRLLDLGWSDDPGLKEGDERERRPVGAVPIAELGRVDRAGVLPKDAGAGSRPSTPGRSRRLSTSSNGSGKGRAKGAVFPPVMLQMVVRLGEERQGAVDAALAYELGRLVQRDDPAMLVQTFTDALDDFPTALARLGGMAAGCTPGFAFHAFNAVVGYLKHVVRLHGTFEHHAAALACAARLLPRVCGTSLRDVRKHKAEHLLLPASIHDHEREDSTGDKSGFKLHAPWRAHDLPVQTAQLVLLRQYLVVSPRDVYVVKRMLFGLEVHAALANVGFARAWLALILDVLRLVHSTFNDRAELRHFLSLAARALALGVHDLPLVCAALRVIMLASARYRRLFAAVGAQTCVRGMMRAYVGGTAAVRDAVECALRSVYRVHAEGFVYQMVVSLVNDGMGDEEGAGTLCATRQGDHETGAGAGVDAEALFDLLSTLSKTSTAASGVASGLKGANDAEEMRALVQMLSGPEVALSDLGKDRAARHAGRVAGIAADKGRDLFPVENVVRLLATIVGADASSDLSMGCMGLMSGMMRRLLGHGEGVKALVHEAVGAIGGLVLRERADVEARRVLMPEHDPGVGKGIGAGEQAGEGKGSWAAARLGYLGLVGAWVRSGGEVGAGAAGLKGLMDVVRAVLLDKYTGWSGGVSGAVGAVAEAMCAAHQGEGEGEGRKGTVARDSKAGGQGLRGLMDELESVFASYASDVDFGRVLCALAGWVRRRGGQVDEGMARAVQRYVALGVRYLVGVYARGSGGVDIDAGGGGGQATPAAGVVALLAEAVFVRGDALFELELAPISAGLVHEVLLPFLAALRIPRDGPGRDQADGAMLRVLGALVRASRAFTGTRSRERPDRDPEQPSVRREPPEHEVGVGKGEAEMVSVVKAVGAVLRRNARAVHGVKGLWAMLGREMGGVLRMARERGWGRVRREVGAAGEGTPLVLYLQGVAGWEWDGMEEEVDDGDEPEEEWVGASPSARTAGARAMSSTVRPVNGSPIVGARMASWSAGSGVSVAALGPGVCSVSTSVGMASTPRSVSMSTMGVMRGGPPPGAGAGAGAGAGQEWRRPSFVQLAQAHAGRARTASAVEPREEGKEPALSDRGLDVFR